MPLYKVDDVVGGEEVAETIDLEGCPDSIHPPINLLAKYRMIALRSPNGSWISKGAKGWPDFGS